MGPSPSKSPGIPYLLQIWPSGCKSSVQNHGSVSAIGKVIHGTIQCGIFNKMSTSQQEKLIPEELFKFDAYKGDVLWMTPEW